MPLIKDNEFKENFWQRLEDDAVLPDRGYYIFSFERLQKDIESLKDRSEKIGVFVKNSTDAETLAPYLEALGLIVLEFPKFADGRAYSQARIIREQLGYEGELRAIGDILPDQAVLMMRCGFDSFEVADTVKLETWKRAVEILSHNYQRSYAVAGDSVRVE